MAPESDDSDEMGRTFELSGDSTRRLLYASQLVALLLALLFVAFPFDTFARILLAVLFGTLVVAAAVALWRRADGDGRTRLAGSDITYDSIADPGQAAKDRWEKAVRRLPGDDERE